MWIVHGYWQHQGTKLGPRLCPSNTVDLPVTRTHFQHNLPGATVRNPTCDKVMRKEAWQNARTWSGFRGFPLVFPEHPPPKTRVCLLFRSSNILWKKSNQGFSLLHLKAMFQLNPSDSSLACLTGSPRTSYSLWIAYSPLAPRGAKLKSILKIQSLF